MGWRPAVAPELSSALVSVGCPRDGPEHCALAENGIVDLVDLLTLQESVLSGFRYMDPRRGGYHLLNEVEKRRIMSLVRWVRDNMQDGQG